MRKRRSKTVAATILVNLAGEARIDRDDPPHLAYVYTVPEGQYLIVTHVDVLWSPQNELLGFVEDLDGELTTKIQRMRRDMPFESSYGLTFKPQARVAFWWKDPGPGPNLHIEYTVVGYSSNK